MTFAEAERLFKTARDPDVGKPLPGAATRLFRFRSPTGIGYLYAVRYHWTDVVTIWPRDRWQLRTQGWHTRTTRERMTRYSPATVRLFKSHLQIAVRPETDAAAVRQVLQHGTAERWHALFDGTFVGADGYPLTCERCGANVPGRLCLSCRLE